MGLVGVVQPAAVGAEGFDCNTALSTIKAKALRRAGFRFAVRYLSRGLGQGGSDLTGPEARRILDAGLALMAVQHVERAPWVPGEALGRAYGRNAVANARQVGLPDGVTVWLDLEGVDPAVSEDAVIAYCNAWFSEVADAGYEPGAYIGSACGLTGEAIYWRLRARHYWRSGNPAPDIPNRGYQMVQTIVPGETVAGVEIDRNVTRADAFGDRATWLAPEERS